LIDSKDRSDSIDGLITPAPSVFIEYLATKRSGIRVSSNSDIDPEHDHKLIDTDGLGIIYAYETEPRIMDGDRYFVYGLDATTKARNKAVNGELPVDGFILHHTDNSTYENMLNYISKVDTSSDDPDDHWQRGYHFLVGRDGLITQAAPLTKRTNHIKGGNHFRRVANTHLENYNTIGVSLHGGYIKQTNHYYHWPATDVQVDAAYALLKLLGVRFGIDITEHTWGHGELQNDRMLAEGHQVVHKCKQIPPYSIQHS